MEKTPSVMDPLLFGSFFMTYLIVAHTHIYKEDMPVFCFVKLFKYFRPLPCDRNHTKAVCVCV